MNLPPLLSLIPLAMASGSTGATPHPNPPTASERPPNVVVVLVDDLGWRDLRCTGSDFYDTPNCDRLAREGVLFEQAYAACPVCSPTRAALQTGKDPARMDTTDWFGGRRKKKLLPAPYIDRLPLEEVTLAEAFGEAGYATAFLGKWHLGGEGYHPEQQGYAVNVGGFHRGSPPGGYFAPYENPKLEDGPEGEHLTGRLAREAVSFIEGQGGDPFFLCLSFYTVHTPLQARPDLQAKYEARRDGLPKSEAPRFLPEGERQARQVQDHAVYGGMVESMDEAVGQVLDALDSGGLAENTIVLLTSDNGGLSTSEGSPTSNAPLRGGKGWLYEGGVRVPLLVRWPGHVKPGHISSTVVCSQDHYPTLLSLAGLDPRPEQHVDGVDYSDILAGGAERVRPDLHWHYPHYGNQGGSPGGAVRVGNYKLIEFFEDGSFELYDLSADPGETRNLAEEQPERVADLARRMVAWREEVNAKMPSPNPDYEGR